METTTRVMPTTSADAASQPRPRPTSAASAQSTDSVDGSGDSWQVVTAPSPTLPSASDAQVSDLNSGSTLDPSSGLNLRPDELLDKLLAQQRIDQAMTANPTDATPVAAEIRLVNQKMLQMKSTFHVLEEQFKVQPENLDIKNEMERLNKNYVQLEAVHAALLSSPAPLTLSDAVMSGSAL